MVDRTGRPRFGGGIDYRNRRSAPARVDLTGLDEIARRIAAAACPEDVFGEIDEASEKSPRDQIALAHRRLTLGVHPDRHARAAVADRELAESCFRRLEELHGQALHKLDAGSYGDRKPVVPVVAPRPPEPQLIKTPKAEYTVGDAIGHGDLATIYHATSAAFAGAELALKLADHPGDNDLLEHEAKILAALYPKPTTTKPKGGLRFISPLLDTFILRGGKTHRRVNVTGRAIEHVSLAEIMSAYPRGLDFRDVVWIFKRTLYALWFVHGKGVVHGAVLPPHVLVHPTGHGAKLIDWCYAVPEWRDGKQHVRAISKPYFDHYPPEILTRKPPSPATDIYMASKCAVTLLGGHAATGVLPSTVPDPIKAFLQGCMLTAQSKRPHDAGALHEEFDELLLRLVGKPTYRPLAMPGK